MIRKSGYVALILFILANLMAFRHAYRFTHFSQTGKARTNPAELSSFDKARILLAGIDNPKPKPTSTPRVAFETLKIKSDVMLEAWSITIEGSRGTVILFHGYCAEKSSLIGRAEEFNKMGYNTLLVDFMGSGGSEGESTNLGYTESREVWDVYEYVRKTGEDEIHLFGTSMGAAAILKAAYDYGIKPTSIMLECPFGSLYQTVSARFRIMNLPPFPLASMLTFWGGFQEGYWAFSHNPAVYASAVTVPALLLYGDKDDRVSLEETIDIYDSMKGGKVLVRYPEEGHDIFTDTNRANWLKDVGTFLESASPRPRHLDSALAN